MRRIALGLVLGLVGTLGTVVACSGDGGKASDPPAATSADPTDDASHPDAQADVLGSLPNGPVSPAALCTSTYGTLHDSYDACCTATDRDYECQNALTCVGFAGQSEGRCTRPPAIGEACGGGKTDAGGGDAAITFAFGVHPKCETDATCNRSAGLLRRRCGQRSREVHGKEARGRRLRRSGSAGRQLVQRPVCRSRWRYGRTVRVVLRLGMTAQRGREFRRC